MLVSKLTVTAVILLAVAAITSGAGLYACQVRTCAARAGPLPQTWASLAFQPIA